MAGTHFDIPEPVRRIECCIAPTNDGGIYYTGPSEDFSRPGRMWWAVPGRASTTFATWREVTTVFHEGVPGHHLQVAQTAYRKEVLNRWQRLMCWVSGHGEGWALYAERLMDELGYLDDPGDKLGMLDGQGFRAARVDRRHRHAPRAGDPARQPVRVPPRRDLDPRARPGVHARSTAGWRTRSSSFEVNRYLGWPGQAPSYKVGERIWLQAREDAQARHGGDFDLKSFHRSALDLGLDRARPAAGRARPASRDPAGPGQRVAGPAGHAARGRARPRGGRLRRRRVGGDHPDPAELASELARAQGPGGRGRRGPDAVVVGCDSVLELDGEVHGKPRRRRRGRGAGGGRCAAAPACCTPGTA